MFIAPINFKQDLAIELLGLGTGHVSSFLHLSLLIKSRFNKLPVSSQVEVDDSVLPVLVVTIEQLLCPLAPPVPSRVTGHTFLSNADAKRMLAEHYVSESMGLC